jgi:phage regulator Rha-like protein
MVKEEIITTEIIEQKIFLIRAVKVMLDADLAKIYGVPTKVLIQSIKRNNARFPSDFMFQITNEEFKNLRSQFVTSSFGRNYGGRRYLPYAFTEHGVAMLSSVLNSPKAVHMNIFIIRAFIKLREMLATHKDLAHKIEYLERHQKENTGQIVIIRNVIAQLIALSSKASTPKKSSQAIGFDTSRADV